MINAARELWYDHKFEDLQEWFDSVAYAKVSYSYYRDLENAKTAILHSNHSKEDDKEFFDTLKSINYDCGYGTQQLYGTIVFKNNTWLSRGEYDGSEWWSYNECPTEEEVLTEE